MIADPNDDETRDSANQESCSRQNHNMCNCRFLCPFVTEQLQLLEDLLSEALTFDLSNII